MSSGGDAVSCLGGSDTAVAANEDVVPGSELRAAEQRIRELERALGRKEMELEILRAAQSEVKKRPRYYGVFAKRPEGQSR